MSPRVAKALNVRAKLFLVTSPCQGYTALNNEGLKEIAPSSHEIVFEVFHPSVAFIELGVRRKIERALSGPAARSYRENIPPGETDTPSRKLL